MMLHKKGHHHYNRSGIALPERVHLPDRRKEANELMDEFFPADAIPSNIFQPLKSLIEIFFYPVIVAVPNASACQQFLPFFNIDNAVLAGPLINVGKQGPMNLPQAIREKSPESPVRTAASYLLWIARPRCDPMFSHF